ncbi:MAG TPA: PA domain-containing protein [Acidimicrobiales bacterium]|nr:PA domain-containing protein [Acidimicrobiales bacterium]
MLALIASLTVLAAPARADHIVCGVVITEDTTLSGDLGPCPGDGIVVAADGISLDLNRYRVFADNGAGDNAGIRLVGVSGVTVMNGIVEGFDAGVFVGGGSGNTIRQVGAFNNVNDALSPPCDLGDGIALLDSSDNTVERSLVVGNGPYGGITMVGDSDNNVIQDNQVRDNNIVGTGGGCGNQNQDEGIRIEGPGADDNLVSRNAVSTSLLGGIALHGHVCNPLNPSAPPEPGNTGNRIVRNSVTSTAGSSVSAGINVLQQGPATVVCPAFANTIERNQTNANDGDGIFIAANSHDNQINLNQANNNSADGIHLNGPRFANQFTNVGPTDFDVVSPDLPPYTEGTDYQVMSGSGSGDVTAELVAIDLAIPSSDPVNPNPVDTSTSACEASDFTEAGFQPGDVALIQRGTCTFVSKVANAIAAGASAVVMFNEGQAGRTSADFGSVGPVGIPVLSATYAVGQELAVLTDAGTVTVHIETNTTNVLTEAAPGAFDNTITGNRAQGNGGFDAYDGTFEPPCDNNTWASNVFGTVNQDCIDSGEVLAGVAGAGGDGGGDAGDTSLSPRGGRSAAGAAA